MAKPEIKTKQINVGAKKEVAVKPHFRHVGKEIVYVGKHDRTIEEKSPEELELAKEKELRLREKQGKELALWKAWKDGGKKAEDLRPLLKSFKPMIEMQSRVYKGNVRLPPSAIDAAFQLVFVQGLQSYDPSKGSLGTYIYQYLNKGKRFIAENQNIARIPENRVYRITEYKTAIEEFSEKNGRIPTTKELAKELNWDLAEVERMEAEQRKDLVAQAWEEDPSTLKINQHEETIKLFQYELEGKDLEVYRYLTGLGRPLTQSTRDIAKILKLEDYQVSRIKSNIEKKLNYYINR